MDIIPLLLVDILQCLPIIHEPNHSEQMYKVALTKAIVCLCFIGDTSCASGVILIGKSIPFSIKG